MTTGPRWWPPRACGRRTGDRPTEEPLPVLPVAGRAVVLDDVSEDLYPVVIAGGGPIGLVSALELARYGIRSLLLERHESTTWHPKARNLNTRTMEIARGWGRAVHDALAAVNLPRAWTTQIIYTRTLARDELGRMPTAGIAGTGADAGPE